MFKEETMKSYFLILFSFISLVAFGQQDKNTKHSHYLDSIHHLLLGVWYNTRDTTDVCKIDWDTIFSRSHEWKYDSDGSAHKDPNLSYSSYHYIIGYDSGCILRSIMKCTYNTVVPLNNGKNDTVLGMIYSISSTVLQFDKEGLLIYKRQIK
jgi:hypothetical protein